MSIIRFYIYSVYIYFLYILLQKTQKESIYIYKKNSFNNRLHTKTIVRLPTTTVTSESCLLFHLPPKKRGFGSIECTSDVIVYTVDVVQLSLTTPFPLPHFLVHHSLKIWPREQRPPTRCCCRRPPPPPPPQ